jgi:hypothetical protein
MHTFMPHYCARILLAALLAALSAASAPADDGIRLTEAVPDDVFLCVVTQHNPDRAFLDRYWGEVFDALVQTGVGDDVMELIGSFANAEQRAEIERLKGRALELIRGVDWKSLASKEMAFAERLPTPLLPSSGPVVIMPRMAFLFRGEDAAYNYEGLVEILSAVAEEINRAIGSRLLIVDRAKLMGGDVARLMLANGHARAEISLTLTDEGAGRLAEITADNEGRRLAIVFNGELL